MRPFWKGFHSKIAGNVRMKRYSIVLYLDNSDKTNVQVVDEEKSRNPAVKVKIINTGKEKKPETISRFPAIILLKNGHEVDRAEGPFSKTVIQSFFRRASV